MKLAIHANFRPQVELNKIHGHRGKGADIEYEVSYKGFSKSHNRWLKADDFGDHQIIRDYHKAIKGKSAIRRGGRLKKKVVKLDL